MEDTATESHAHPERPVWRLGVPVAATALSLALVVVMLAMSGTAQTVTLVVLLALAFGLMVGRALAVRRAGRTPDGPALWGQFVFMAGFFAALFFLSTSRTTTWALIEIGLGAVLALFITWATSPVRPPRGWRPGRERSHPQS